MLSRYKAKKTPFFFFLFLLTASACGTSKAIKQANESPQAGSSNQTETHANSEEEVSDHPVNASRSSRPQVIVLPPNAL